IVTFIFYKEYFYEE
ncbi:TPA: DUF1270 family protein, partial [Staphylococcus aureus]|nr:DUF1270 family protein [Staphylococcus aureus]HCX7913227.1 DUF1270 family protein [Staphylococcus aureus]HCX8048831.1 DUF1270 family protein [Staphylococcus aureus]HCX8074922.1 DUF1270 family protein [Staphylococcus aureus]HCX8083648.1 DUF1270 family protein [Staphylococcus aureus]